MATNDSTGTTPTTNPTPRAKLTDHEVALIHEMIEEGMTYSQVVKKFEGMMAR